MTTNKKLKFYTYSHQESEVPAIQLSTDTCPDVSAALGKELEKGLLTTFQAEYDTANRCYNYVFRYKTDSVDSTLEPTDYLVQLNTGNYVVRDAETFAADYIPTYKDEDVMPEVPKTPKKALVDFIAKFYPDAGITSEDQLTAEALKTVAEGLKAWYDAESDTLDLKFTDCSIVDPTGLADLMSAFPQASFIKETTKFTLNFNNGAWHEGDPNTDNNCFNRAALDILVAEIKKCDDANRLIGVTFMSVGHDAPSAIAPSVTDDEWLSFCSDLMSCTGIQSVGDIKR